MTDNPTNARMMYEKLNVAQNLVKVCDEVWRPESRADAKKQYQFEGPQ